MKNSVNFDKVRLVKVIEVTTTDGTGLTQDDPCRMAKRYWTEDGEFIGLVVTGYDPVTKPNASWKDT